MNAIVTNITTFSAGLSLTERRIYYFARLPAGWDFGRGVRAHRSAVKAAISASQTLSRFLPVEAFPKEDGSIRLNIYHGDETAVIDCRPDGLYDFLMEDQDDELIAVVEGASLVSVLHSIGDMKWLGPSPDSSIRLDTAQPKIATNPSPFKTRLMVAGYPSLTSFVSTGAATVYATISLNSMDTRLLETLPYSGELQNLTYPPALG